MSLTASAPAQVARLGSLSTDVSRADHGHGFPWVALARISHRIRCIGVRIERIVLRPRFFSNPQDPQCRQTVIPHCLNFHPSKAAMLWRPSTVVRSPRMPVPCCSARTDDPLHGNQEGKFFHGYYDCYCYLPLYIFCGRHLLAAKLRRSNIDGAAGSVEEVARTWRRSAAAGQERASRCAAIPASPARR